MTAEVDELMTMDYLNMLINAKISTYGIANQRMEYEIGLVQIFHLRLRAQPRTIGF